MPQLYPEKVTHFQTSDFELHMLFAKNSCHAQYLLFPSLWFWRGFSSCVNLMPHSPPLSFTPFCLLGKGSLPLAALQFFSTPVHF